MDDQLSVFVVDDDQIILDVLNALLEGECRIETFDSAKKCLLRLEASLPDLILLDVTMPEMDGYALCRHLKDDWNTQDIPVIFVSASDDIETRLQCYDAGGDDFVLKPVDTEELRRKIKVCGRILAEKQMLREQAGYAQRTAMSAMTSMSELGVVLQFLSKSFACTTQAELAQAVIDAMLQFDLQAAVLLGGEGGILSVSHNGHNVPLELSILKHVRHSDRIFQFKSRCVFNYESITLMVNNMPLEDAERCGRIRDNGALLAEGAAARLRAIEQEQRGARQRAGIESALPRIHSTLDAVQTNYRRNCLELTQVMIEFQENLLKSYVHLGLSESQEEHLTAMADTYMQRMVGTQDESLQIVGRLEALATSLQSFVKT